MSLPGVSEICKKIEEITDEEHLYYKDFYKAGGTSHEFPIMSKFFTDVKDSIPNILLQAGTLWESKSVGDMYKEAKEKLRFGETEDC